MSSNYFTLKGLALAAYPFGGIFASVLIGHYMRYIGRKKAIIIALIVEAIISWCSLIYQLYDRSSQQFWLDYVH